MCALRRSSWRPPSVNRAQLATTFARMQSCRPSCVSRNSVRNSWRICAKDLTNCWLWNRKAPVSFCRIYEAKAEYHYEACAAVNIFLPSTPLYQQISRHVSERASRVVDFSKLGMENIFSSAPSGIPRISPKGQMGILVKNRYLDRFWPVIGI